MTQQTERTGDAVGERSASAISPADIRCQLEKMVASRTFQTAESQKAFLKYAVGEVLEGRANLIKEYLIGVEAFSRGELFDPRLDPIVRTQARKLRARLLKYYETEGRDDPVRIDFPKGSYVPVFSSAHGAPAADEPPVSGETVNADAALADERISLKGQPIPVSTIRSKPAIIAIAVSLLMFILGSLLFYSSPQSSREPVLASGSSIAVLPFANLDADSANEFLSDGLTDDLIDSLGQVPGLRVVARTSAFRFKAKALSVREIGQQLNVHAVLKGTVRVVGNNLRITAQLINASDGHHLWSGTFDRSANDADSVQKEISTEVAGVLGARLKHGGDESGKALSANLPSPTHDAYQYYLRGLYLWNKLSADGLHMAIQSFEKAIAVDPSFARAYSALADSYVMAPQVSDAVQIEIIPKIRSAANKALALDSSLGEAHIDLAICAEYDFDWATAEREFKKGLDLSPDNAVAHLWYAKYLAIVGVRQEVLTQRKIAQELDPVSPYASQSVAGYLSVIGQYDEAIEQFRSAIALEPNFGLSHQGLGVAYVLRRRYADGIAELETACRLMPGPRREALLGWAYSISGNRVEARKILSGLLARSRNQGVPALAVALVYIGLGDKDSAFRWLEKAADDRDLDLTLKWDSFYEPLRTDARYHLLLQRMRLAQ